MIYIGSLNFEICPDFDSSSLITIFYDLDSATSILYHPSIYSCWLIEPIVIVLVSGWLLIYLAFNYTSS